MSEIPASATGTATDTAADLGADSAGAPLPKPAFVPPREPLYDWGTQVVAAQDLLNDGSHPQVAEGALLAPRGTPGTVVRIGHAPELNAPVYLVEFPGGMLVGCLEEEVSPVGGPRRGVPGVME